MRTVNEFKSTWERHDHLPRRQHGGRLDPHLAAVVAGKEAAKLEPTGAEIRALARGTGPVEARGRSALFRLLPGVVSRGRPPVRLWRRLLRSLSGLALFLACCAVTPAGRALAVEEATAATLRVPADYSTIQAAIDAARYGDVVSVSSGTYRENVLVSKRGIALRGAGRSLSTIEAPPGSAWPVVRLANVDGTVRLAGFTIRNGQSRHDRLGGGVDIENASPVVEDNAIAGNRSAVLGAGIAIRGVRSSPLIKGNVIRDNRRAGTRYGGFGGGIFIGDGARPTIADNQILANEAWATGGAIYVGRVLDGGGLIRTGASPVIYGNLISGNFSDAGGAIHVTGPDSAPTIQRNRIVDNYSDFQEGAGIAASSGAAPRIVHNTVVGTGRQSWVKAYGIRLNDSSAGSLDVRGNIVAFNRDVGIRAPTSAVLQYNCVFAHPRGNYAAPAVPGPGSLSVDPLFVDPARGDYALQQASPLIDAGDPAFTDPDGTRADIGAFGGPVLDLTTDRDRDGLADFREGMIATDALRPDTDGDRVLDGEEVDLYRTDPVRTDTDGDGSRADDGTEIEVGTDPHSRDSTPAFSQAMDLASLRLRALNLSQVPYEEPSPPPVPALDPPAGGGPDSPGLVFEEALAVLTKDFPLAPSQSFYVKARPRAGVYKHSLVVYVDGDADGTYDLKTYPDAGVDYSSSAIQPPIDAALLPIAGKVLSQFLVGREQPGAGFPQLFDFAANGYVRFNGFAPQTVGASYRVAGHRVFTADEDFPVIRELYFRVAGPGVARLWALVDSEAFTGAVSFDLAPGRASHMTVDGTWFARRDLTLASDPETGFITYSSMFWKDERDTPLNSSDEAHDTDTIVVGYDRNGDRQIDKIVERRINNPSKPGELVLTDFAALEDGQQLYWSLENRDRDPAHYAAYSSAQYERRDSYAVALTSSQVPLSVHLHEQHTDSEFNDNLVVNGTLQQGLRKAVGLADGTRIQYRTSAFLPDDSDGDSVTDFLENVVGSNPADPDSDHDGAPDGAELKAGTPVIARVGAE